ncbi:MAG: hypothetical protein ACRD1L_12900, partial [Terriglobales bacterium]
MVKSTSMVLATCCCFLGLWGCGGATQTAQKVGQPPPPPGTIVVTLAAASASAGPLQTSRLSATISSDPKGVTWSASAGTVAGLDSGCSSGSSCCPSGNCAAIYSAPPDVTSNASATVTATSVSDPSKSASVTITLTAASAWEDLAAYTNGLNLAVAKPYKDLERGAGTGIYQPDRMIFHEISPGANGQPLNTEIWRLDNDAPSQALDGSNEGPPSWYISGVLNRPAWNENGTYFTLTANPCAIGVFCRDPTQGKGADLHNYLYDAAGDLMQLVTPSSAPEVGMALGQYMPWDKVNPNLFYVVNSDTTSSGLFSVDVSNNFAVKMVAALPLRTDPVTNTPINKVLQSYPSEDDVVMIEDVNPPPLNNPPPAGCTPGVTAGCEDYIPNLYMVDANPNHTATYGTVVQQYPINFGLTGTSCTPEFPNVGCGTHSQATEYHFHDIFFQRDSADHYIFNYGPKGSVG